ncbi:MAG: 16S rRNA pseudouridine(516) synthase, partial [Planctomycetota bacterium]
AKTRIRAGRVTVAGASERDAGRRVGEEPLTLDGEPIEPVPDVVHLLLHKPAGYVCSHDQREGPSVYDLLPPRLAAAGPEAAGRLDRDTTGLLILTTDGQLLHRLIAPQAKVPKRYRVRYTGRLRKDAVARCQAGFDLPDERRDKPTRPARLEIHDDHRATLVLSEGRYHQVKRMFASLGATVTALHRDRIGELELPADLPPGACRAATAEELLSAQERTPRAG